MNSLRTIAFGTTMTTQMMMPKAFVVGNMMYYLADELKVYSPKFFVGTSKTIRVIVERKKIPEYDYIYAIKTGVEWNILDATSKKAKLLIGKDWFDTNINVVEPKVVKPKIVKPKPTVVVETVPVVVVVDGVGIVENNDEDDIIETDIIEEAPPIFELNEEEKFKDGDGNVLEIETRGERHEDKIYFSMKDISIVLDMPSLKQSLIHKNSVYERNVDYKTLNITGGNSACEKTTNKKRIYLTYEGLLRVLFASNNKNAKFFRKWATTIIYTHQLGTVEQKEELGADLLKISLKKFKEMFKAYTGKFSCIYLLELGTVGALRELFSISPDIPDDVIVYKYGFTDDIVRRFTEHTRDYGKIKDVNVYLSQFTLIDIKYMSDAENDIRQFFNDFDKSLLVEGRNELVTLNTNELKFVRKHYEVLRNQYSGSTQGLQNIIDGLKMEMFRKDMEYKINNEIQIGIINCKNIEIQLQIERLINKDLLLQIEKSKNNNNT